jgi:hypothetical protein
MCYTINGRYATAHTGTMDTVQKGIKIAWKVGADNGICPGYTK